MKIFLKLLIYIKDNDKKTNRLLLPVLLTIVASASSFGMDMEHNPPHTAPQKDRKAYPHPRPFGAYLPLMYKRGWYKEWNTPQYDNPRNYFTLFPSDLSQVTPEFLCSWLNGLQSFFGDNKFNQIDYSRSLYDVAKFKNHPNRAHIVEWFKSYLSQNPAWLKSWYQTSQRKLNTFEAQAFSNSLFAHALLEIRPDRAWLKAWHQTSQRKLDTFDAQAFSNSLFTHALLETQPDPTWLKAWYQTSQRKLDTFDAQAFSNSLFAHALLGIRPDRTWLEVSQRYLTQKNYHLKAYSQLFLVNQWCQINKNPLIVDFQRVKFNFNIKSIKEANGGSLRVSQLEEDVKRILQRSPYTIESQKWIPETLSHGDIYLPKLHLVIQVDGPFHFLANGSHNLQTQLQTKILKHFNYNLIRISYQLWDSLQSDNEKEKYLQKEIKTLLLLKK